LDMMGRTLGGETIPSNFFPLQRRAVRSGQIGALLRHVRFGKSDPSVCTSHFNYFLIPGGACKRETLE
jgi:hypothetical protein